MWFIIKRLIIEDRFAEDFYTKKLFLHFLKKEGLYLSPGNSFTVQLMTEDGLYLDFVPREHDYDYESGDIIELTEEPKDCSFPRKHLVSGQNWAIRRVMRKFYLAQAGAFDRSAQLNGVAKELRERMYYPKQKGGLKK